MTIEEAKKFNFFQHDREDIEKHIDEIYADFENEKTCDGCIHKPKRNENYPIECGTCSRFYADSFKELIDD